MNPLAKVFMLVNGGDDVGMEVAWERRSELNPLHARRRHCAQQTTEERRASKAFQACFCFGSIAIHVLADEMDFAIAMQAQFVNLGDDVRRQAAFLTSA